MSELPEGWHSVPLLIVSEMVRGVTYSKADVGIVDQQGYIGVMRANNIQDGKFDLSDVVYVPTRLVGNAQYVKEGDVVIATSSGSISVVGKAAQATRDMNLGFGAFCGVLRPSSMLNQRYFGHFFSSERYRSYVASVARGVNINNLKRSHFEDLEIPLAPLPEQARIANKLDSLLSRVDSCRERLDRVPAILRRFRQSVLAAATSGKLTEGWRKKRRIQFDWSSTCIDEVATDIRYGTSKKCFYEPKSTPVIRIPNVVSGAVSIDDLKYAEFEENDLSTLSLQQDDILMIRSNGSVELVGRTAIVTNIAVGFLYAGYLIRIRIDQKKANARFVNLCLSSPLCRNTIEQIAKSTSGVNNINAQEIKKLEIPLPSLEEQDEIVRRVSELLVGADEFDARFNLSVQIAERLSSSILKLAFRGELVPQDANDEPADILLERIRRHRDKTSDESKRKGRSKMTRTTRKSNSEIRQLTAVLLENDGVMKPEKLLDAAGYTDESIEGFYLALKKSIADGAILDPRDHDNQIVLVQDQK